MLPWSFWRRVELHHRLAPQRLALWLILPVLTLYVMTVLTGLAAAAVLWGNQYTNRPALRSYAFTSRSESKVSAVFDRRASTVTIRRDGVAAVIQIPALDTLPTLHETAIGRVLVLGPDGDAGWTFDVQKLIAPPVIPRRLGIAFFVFRSPQGAIQPSAFTWVKLWRPSVGSPSPVRELIIESVAMPVGLGGRYVGRQVAGLSQDTSATLAPIAIFGFTLLAAIIVLVSPSEWRSTHVRRAHLARIAAYSWAPGVGAYCLSFSAFVWLSIGHTVWWMLGRPGNVFSQHHGWTAPPSWLGSFATSESSLTLLLVFAVWLPIYWGFALKRGMRLRRPWFLLAFLTIAGWLGMLAALMLTDDLGLQLYRWLA